VVPRWLTACAAALLLGGGPAALAAQGPYVPPAGEAWERRAPEQVGLDPAWIRAAVEFALANESRAPRDLLEQHRLTFGREPHGAAVGAFRERGDPTGIILRHGYIVAEWGDPHRVDVTYSVTKSFLSSVVGLAYDRRLISDLHEPVGRSVQAVVARDGEVLEPFVSPHARRITWDHLLRQTSDWQGTLWGKPDWADRPRGDHDEWRARARHKPGAIYLYNDVRVNLLALAAQEVWRRPLPEVLREHLMQPIGASDTWRWYGYETSWVVLDGQLVQTPSGGAHWGGGLWISARDMARFGLLTLRRGRWGERQVLSEEWLRQALTPGSANDAYGFMNFFLNTGRRALPSAPEQAFIHQGAGANLVYVDPVHDIVIVARWIQNMRALDGVVERVLGAVRE
jgi:CubicO group peptidase (beta-lactamase class C family)